MKRNKDLCTCRNCGKGENPDKFSLVYVEGEKAPSVKHSDPVCAGNEAERLARLPWNHGRKVYILSTIKVVFVEVPQVPVTTVDI